jgi:hypothetical protein
MIKNGIFKFKFRKITCTSLLIAQYLLLIVHVSLLRF